LDYNNTTKEEENKKPIKEICEAGGKSTVSGNHDDKELGMYRCSGNCTRKRSVEEWPAASS